MKNNKYIESLRYVKGKSNLPISNEISVPKCLINLQIHREASLYYGQFQSEQTFSFV